MIYTGGWAEGGARAMCEDFDGWVGKPGLYQQLADEGAVIVLAHYEVDDYEGWAFVLYRIGAQLFEVNASHCSCFGLEQQWEPEETNTQALFVRLQAGGFGGTEMEVGLGAWLRDMFALEARKMVLPS